jgi:acetylornithine deacetylase/succinyl-diaminopimelate desuccinylase-like protein
MTHARLATRQPVLFAATVGEEGSGNLRGVKHLLAPTVQPSLRPTAFIALDGAGLERIVHRALGARRYRVTYRGPGGHSWAAFGVANPANAVGLAVAEISRVQTPHAARTTHAVVRLGGGTALNAIPQESWFDVDLRSEDPAALRNLDAEFRRIVARAAQEEDGRRVPGTEHLSYNIEALGERPSGITPRTHPLVQTAIAATRAVAEEHHLACASTDANAPIALGVPAVALGAGGRAGDAHLPSEWYENDKGALGVVRALLVTAAVAAVQ